jgi:hypothetical protein
VEHPEPDAVPIGVDREERIVLEGGRFGLLALEELGQPLDRYQVRTWRAWYAHIPFAMLALAYLAAS